MVVIVDTSNHPGSQPLPRLDDFLLAVLSMFMPAPPDVAAKRFDPSKSGELRKEFTKKPRDMPDGGGCMLTAYDVLNVLYGPGFSQKLMEEVHGRAKQAADNGMKTKLFQQKVEQAKAANPNLTDAEARQMVWKQWHSAHNTSDHMYALMGEKGLAGEKVHTANKDADEVIRRLTPTEPGVYAFGLAVRDHHTVTLVVEKKADGTQKMIWLDQYTQYDTKGDKFTAPRGAPREVKEGHLGDALTNWVFNGPESTNIYALRPPAGKAP